MYTYDCRSTSGALYLLEQRLFYQYHNTGVALINRWTIKEIILTQKGSESYQRVETYSVKGGLELTSRARPKSAILMMSLETNRFSARTNTI